MTIVWIILSIILILFILNCFLNFVRISSSSPIAWNATMYGWVLWDKTDTDEGIVHWFIMKGKDPTISPKVAYYLRTGELKIISPICIGGTKDLKSFKNVNDVLRNRRF